MTRFSLDSEEALKLQMKEAMEAHAIPFEREYRLDAKNRPDFMVFEHAVEVKIKGSAKAIYKQCERYAGFPETLNDKPCYVINLGKSWL